jgi:hypothetical protein
MAFSIDSISTIPQPALASHSATEVDSDNVHDSPFANIVSSPLRFKFSESEREAFFAEFLARPLEAVSMEGHERISSP